MFAVRYVGIASVRHAHHATVDGGSGRADRPAHDDSRLGDGRDRRRGVLRAPPLVQVADGLSRAVAAGSISPARAALLRADALFHPRAAALQAGTTIARVDGRGATP